MHEKKTNNTPKLDTSSTKKNGYEPPKITPLETTQPTGNTGGGGDGGGSLSNAS